MQSLSEKEMRFVEEQTIIATDCSITKEDKRACLHGEMMNSLWYTGIEPSSAAMETQTSLEKGGGVCAIDSFCLDCLDYKERGCIILRCLVY